MALLDAFVLEQDKEQKTLLLDFLEIPEGEPTPTLTIATTQKVIDTHLAALERFATIKVQYRGKGKRAVGIPVDKPIDYCLMVLKVAYQDSTGLLDVPSLDVILKWIQKKPAVARKVASKLIEVLDGESDLKDEFFEEDKKK